MYNYDRAILDDHIFNFIYGCALHDAVLQKAFKGERTWIADVTEAKETVKKYINRVVKGDFKNADDETKKKHEDFFLKTAKEVCKQINNSNFKPTNISVGNFTFGNAQKLINMTVKHVYAHTYSIHLLDYASIRNHFRHCHCPMDSIMLDKVWKEYKNSFDNSIRKKELGNCECFHKSWGNEDFNTDKQILPCRYKKFQEAIKNIVDEKQGNIYPIEYDYIFW